MIKDNRNNEQIYGRNDMIMLDPNNKIYGSLGIADNYVMKTEEGTRLVLSNPKQGRFGDVLTEFNMYGRSEQFSTTGAQLFNENIEKNSRGVTIKVNGSTATFNGIVSDEVNIRVNIQKSIKLKHGKYTASSSNKKILADFSVVKANGETKYYSHIEIDGTEKEVRFRILFGLSPSVKGDVINETANVMINEGDIALPYEPYTGGIPSPSPDYPQEIKSVVNPIIKVRGKNLFDQTKVFKNIDIGIRSIVGVDCYNIVGNGQSTDRRYYLIECKPNTKYYITFVNPNNNIFIGIADKNYIGIEDVVIFDNVTSKTFMTGSNAKFIVLNADGASDICISEDNADYEPYKEQSIQLPITLNAIPVQSGGNVTIDGQQYIADYVDVERGKLVRRVFEHVFSGSDRWSVAADGAQYLQWRTSEKPGIMDSTSNKKCLCSCLIANIISETIRGENYISTQLFDGVCRIWISANVATSKLTGEKAFLALIVPEEIPLTKEEIREFKELVTYYPVTIIENNYNTWMKATYKSIESV